MGRGFQHQATLGDIGSLVGFFVPHSCPTQPGKYGEESPLMSGVFAVSGWRVRF